MQDATKTSEMAGTKGFTLLLILLPIVAELPQRDLLLAKRASRAWEDLINDSLILQAKVLLKQTQTGAQPQEGFIAEVNPLLRELSTPFFAHLESHDPGNLDDDPDTEDFLDSWRYCQLKDYGLGP
ncbi:hypothetical protein BDW69DRAFT_183548 [Aspergillus filifer]